MIEKIEPTHQLSIYMSGPIEVAKQTMRKFCRRGLCVTIEPTLFIYTGGEENGFRVGMLNYPRFPTTAPELEAIAEELTHKLLDDTEQDSALIVGNIGTHWITKRSA